MRLLGVLVATSICSGLAQANDLIYTYRGPDGVTLFTDQKEMPSGYELLSVRKGWSYTPRPLDTALRDAYDETIVLAAHKHAVEPALIKAIIHAESHFNAHAISRAGAVGLMQLMPETARSLNVDNSFDAKQNIFGGAKFLQYLHGKFDRLDLVLAAYNAGEGNVRRYGGIPPFVETQGYVAKVLELLPRYQQHFSDQDSLVAQL